MKPSAFAQAKQVLLLLQLTDPYSFQTENLNNRHPRNGIAVFYWSPLNKVVLKEF